MQKVGDEKGGIVSNFVSNEMNDLAISEEVVCPSKVDFIENPVI